MCFNKTHVKKVGQMVGGQQQVLQIRAAFV